MQPTKTQAIKAFLEKFTHPDLASLYNHDMEVQVLVAQDDGELCQETVKGRHRKYYVGHDGSSWKDIRIPWNAYSEPEYNDTPMTFDLLAHAAGIGCTGWDWVNKCSRWVGYDFDSLVGHSKGLEEKDLEQIRETVAKVPWVTLRLSTSGKGLHLYVFLQPPVPTNTHNEHAALARSILSTLSAETGHDFQAKVDVCGHILWIWHRKMKGTNGLKLLKAGTTLSSVAPDWRDHVPVVTGRKRKVTPAFVINESDDKERLFEELSGQRIRVKLDADHMRLLDYLRDNNCVAWWNNDHWMLITHTVHLKEAHEALSLKGTFKTKSTGKDRGADHNCFSGDTEVITKQGVKTLRDLAKIGNADLYVRTPEGFRWINCPVKSFGEQEVVPLHFGDGSIVRATLNHRWLYRDQNTKKISSNFKFTYELDPGKTQLPISQFELSQINWEGYAHGFVYGDGWVENHRGKLSCSVALFKRDNDLLKLLCRFGNQGSQKYKEIYINYARQLPSNWKELPNNPTKEYALGFILGLVSADGFVNSRIQIFQSNLDALEEIRKLAIYAGLRTYPVRKYTNGNGFPNSKIGYAFSISSYNLTKEHFLRKDHQENFQKREKSNCMTISYIGAQKQKEEVFCAVVPVYQNFTLANHINTLNCFCFPMRHGAWAIRRYGLGVSEEDTWTTDSAGWTKCYFNRNPDLPTAAKAGGGLEMKNGAFQFRTAEEAIKALHPIGVFPELPNWILGRETIVKASKDGRVIVEINAEKTDQPDKMSKWVREKSKWTKVFDAKKLETSEPEIGNYDDMVRHIVTEGNDNYGWVVQSGGIWRTEPLEHVKPVLLGNFGLNAKEMTAVLGTAIMQCWTIVNRPFDDEYPTEGNRQWNRNAAKLAYPPTEDKENLSHPHWDKVLKHCGSGLDEAVKHHPWCKTNGIFSGADYLKYWIASLFKEPMKPLPYLFLWSTEQNTGKSILHEALSILMTSGYARADCALTSPSGFNGELENAVLCVVEETDLSKSRQAYNKIKDWVTSPILPIHKKNKTPYTIPNTTHWIQTANDRRSCPIFSGDTRITMIEVPPLGEMDMIPKAELMLRLKKEAPDFMASVLALELPNSNDRLNMPIIATETKMQAEEATLNELESFLQNECTYVPGEVIKFSDFYEAFKMWLDPGARAEWTKIRVGRELPSKFPKGRYQGPDWYIGNVKLGKEATNGSTRPKLILSKERLVPQSNGEHQATTEESGTRGPGTSASEV